jgi:hypothetical protein
MDSNLSLGCSLEQEDPSARRDDKVVRLQRRREIGDDPVLGHYGALGTSLAAK